MFRADGTPNHTAPVLLFEFKLTAACSTSYLQLAVNRQPGYRQGPRRASLYERNIIFSHEIACSFAISGLSSSSSAQIATPLCMQQGMMIPHVTFDVRFESYRRIKSIHDAKVVLPHICSGQRHQPSTLRWYSSSSSNHTEACSTRYYQRGAATIRSSPVLLSGSTGTWGRR